MHDVRKNVSKQSQPQQATSKQRAPLMNIRLTRFGVLPLHSIRLFIAMSVDTRLASERIAVRSQNPWLCIYRVRSDITNPRTQLVT